MPADDSPLRLDALHVVKTYPAGRATKPQPVVSDVSLSVCGGAVAALVGPSGCGKSTLLRILAGTQQCESGSITVTNGYPGEIGIVFQNDNCLPWLSTRENVLFGMIAQRLENVERERRADLALRRVGMSGFDSAYPAQLSGGQQQRVAFGRLLAAGKRIWLLDEPFSALDARSRMAMQKLVLTEVREADRAVLLVTHDLSEAAAIADVIHVLSAAPASVVLTFRGVRMLRADRRLQFELVQYLHDTIGLQEVAPVPSELIDYVEYNADAHAGRE